MFFFLIAFTHPRTHPGVCGGTTEIDMCGLCAGDSTTCAHTAMVPVPVFPHDGYPKQLPKALAAPTNASTANATGAAGEGNTTNVTAVPQPPPPPDPCEGAEEGFCTCPHPVRRLSLLFGVGARTKNKTQWCNDRCAYACISVRVECERCVSMENSLRNSDWSEVKL